MKVSLSLVDLHVAVPFASPSDRRLHLKDAAILELDTERDEIVAKSKTKAAILHIPLNGNVAFYVEAVAAAPEAPQPAPVPVVQFEKPAVEDDTVKLVRGEDGKIQEVKASSLAAKAAKK